MQWIGIFIQRYHHPLWSKNSYATNVRSCLQLCKSTTKRFSMHQTIDFCSSLMLPRVRTIVLLIEREQTDVEHHSTWFAAFLHDLQQICACARDCVVKVMLDCLTDLFLIFLVCCCCFMVCGECHDVSGANKQFLRCKLRHVQCAWRTIKLVERKWPCPLIIIIIVFSGKIQKPPPRA